LIGRPRLFANLPQVAQVEIKRASVSAFTFLLAIDIGTQLRLSREQPRRPISRKWEFRSCV